MKLKKGDFGNITTSSAGDHSIPLVPRFGGATAQPTATASPLQVIARMARLLDQQNVDSRNRWIVLDSVFIELLKVQDQEHLAPQTKIQTTGLLLLDTIVQLQPQNRSIKLNPIEIPIHSATLFVGCTYMAERYFDQKLLLTPNITQRRGT